MLNSSFVKLLYSDIFNDVKINECFPILKIISAKNFNHTDDLQIKFTYIKKAVVEG